MDYSLRRTPSKPLRRLPTTSSCRSTRLRSPQRLYAGLVDCALVAAATAVFGAVGYKMLPKLVFTKPLVLTAAVVPVLLWAVYQYLLTFMPGATAGMRVAKIRLSTFKGNQSRTGVTAAAGSSAFISRPHR